MALLVHGDSLILQVWAQLKANQPKRVAEDARQQLQGAETSEKRAKFR